jgi:transmembrane sensor
MSAADRIEAQAATWLERRSGQDWRPEDEAELAAWLDANEAHRVAYWRLEHGWERVGRLSALRNGHARADAATAPSIIRWAATVAAVLVVVVIFSAPPAPQPSIHRPFRYETPVGGLRTVQLSDGSRLELSTNTEMTADVSPTDRTVWLTRGEVYFDVRHDPKHPFVIFAANHKLTVLGTNFSVRLDSGLTRVVVLRGRVRLAPAQINDSSPVEDITGGQMALARDRSVLITATSGDSAQNLLSWRTGMLAFDQSTLRDVAGEFNRYNHTQLVVDPSAAEMRIGGSFEAKNVDGFVRLLRSAYGLKIAQAQDRFVISKGG